MKCLPKKSLKDIKFNLLFFVLWTSFITSCTPSKNIEEATILFKGGTIYTLDTERAVAQAIAIKDSIILFVGSHI